VNVKILKNDFQIILDNVYSHSEVAEKLELSLCGSLYCCRLFWFMGPFNSISASRFMWPFYLYRSFTIT